jgi:hypothetical protein
MSSTFELFKQQIDEAVGIINQAQVIDNNDNNGLPVVGDLIDTQSLLARCDAACENNEKEKPTIRIIHHLACSGGTLISKCLSALPNTFLLSEVHPYTDLHLGSGKPKYLPSDILSLSKYANIPNIKQLAADIFISNIIKTNQHVSSYGGNLIIREHTHSDFCLGTKVVDKPVVFSLLEPYFQIKNIVTVRNPIDTYLSLVKNNWKHFEPFNFEEYCKRFIQMIDSYSESDIYCYEDFVREPNLEMQKMCLSLDLPYSDYFIDIFELSNVTGDSGRTSSIISERARRDMSPEFLQEVQASKTLKYIIKKFNY